LTLGRPRAERRKTVAVASFAHDDRTDLAERTRSDAGVAALLAEAACRGAAYNVRINVAALADRNAGASYVEEALGLVAITSKHAAEATEAVERAIG
jgi:glutamate formiminotransferase/formiminotetrahydrofolate cyclodeaminase